MVCQRTAGSGIPSDDVITSSQGTAVDEVHVAVILH